MDMTEYLENMGITICQRAFFSYMAKPQGSYGLHMIFRLFLKKKRIIRTGQAGAASLPITQCFASISPVSC